jgi:hypothetical protein
MKKVLAATLLIASLTTTTAFAKEDDHEKEFKHHKQHEVKKVKTPVSTPSPTPTIPTQTPTIPTTTTITNPLTGFAVTLGIPAGFDTSVKRVSIMWANLNNVYGYNVYINGVKQTTANSSQAKNNLYGVTVQDSLLFSNGAYQVILPKGTYTIGISVVDQNGNESQQCIQTITVQ